MLSEPEIAALAERVMLYLAERGVKIQHPSVLTVLDQAGAQVDIEAEIVRFPRGNRSAPYVIPACSKRESIRIACGFPLKTCGNNILSAISGRGCERLLPRELVEAALKKAPKPFTLAAAIPKLDLALPHPTGDFYSCAGTGARGIIDPEGGDYRRLTVSDVREWGRLINALDNVDLCAFSTSTDAPPKTVDVHSLRALLETGSSSIQKKPCLIFSS